jgi:hypothetical protein
VVVVERLASRETRKVAGSNKPDMIRVIYFTMAYWLWSRGFFYFFVKDPDERLHVLDSSPEERA